MPGGRRLDSYDEIGRGYTGGRRADPRIARQIQDALGDAGSVLNVGAGTGNYEPIDRVVVAVEPSLEMHRQRDPAMAPSVRGVAEALPFSDQTFDACLAILTLHHWHHLAAGLAEMRRVSGRQVIFMFDAAMAHGLWLIDDYFPEIASLPTERNAPDVATVAEHLDVTAVDPIPVPADCLDGFAGAYWNRPEAYLDPTVRQSMSCFALMDPATERQGAERLRASLADGSWDRRHGHLRQLPECDIGYRLVIAGR